MSAIRTYQEYLKLLGNRAQEVQPDAEFLSPQLTQPRDFQAEAAAKAVPAQSPIAVAPVEIPETNASVNRSPAIVPSNDLDPTDQQALPDSVDVGANYQAPRPQEPDLQSELKDVQDQSARERAMANLAGSVDFTARAFNGNIQSPEAQAMFKARAEEADTPLKNFQQKLQVQDKEIARLEDDPNSDISKLYRDAISKALPGQDMSKFANLSASQAAKIFPSLKGLVDKSDKMTEYQRRQLDLQERALDIKDDKTKEEKLTKGQEARDRVAAKTVGDWYDAGDRNMILSDIEKLKSIEARLDAGENVSGSIKGRIQGDIFNTAGQDITDTVASVTQKNLRQILGGQFAQQEGEQLIKRAYDPKMDEAINLARIRALRIAMEDAAKAKDVTTREFLEKGTLSKSLIPSFDGTSKAPASTPDKSAPFPKQVRKGNQVATVSNEQELAEAQAEGFN